MAKANTVRRKKNTTRKFAPVTDYVEVQVTRGRGAGNVNHQRFMIAFDKRQWVFGMVIVTPDYNDEKAFDENGKTFDEAPDSYKLASPLFHLTPNDPPTLIFHGTIDSLVPIAQADALADKLKELGIDYVYERYDGWPHTMDLAEAINRRCVYQMEQFFKKHIPMNSRQE